MSLQSMLESVATIFRPSSVSRGTAQGVTQNFTVLQLAMACSQQEMGASEAEMYRQRMGDVSTTLYFATNPQCTENDLATVTATRIGLTTNYLIRGRAIGVGRPNTPWTVPALKVDDPMTLATVVSPTVVVGIASATLGGNVSSNGASPLTKVGVVWSLTSANNYPRVGGAGVSETDTGSPAVGVFTLAIGGLTTGLTYSFAPFAVNGKGTTYGLVMEFVPL